MGGESADTDVSGDGEFSDRTSYSRKQQTEIQGGGRKREGSFTNTITRN